MAGIVMEQNTVTLFRCTVSVDCEFLSFFLPSYCPPFILSFLRSLLHFLIQSFLLSFLLRSYVSSFLQYLSLLLSSCLPFFIYIYISFLFICWSPFSSCRRSLFPSFLSSLHISSLPSSLDTAHLSYPHCGGEGPPTLYENVEDITCIFVP